MRWELLEFSLASLAVVAVAWGFTRVLGQRAGVVAHRGTLRILEAISVGHGRSLLVLRAGNRVFLLGLAEKQISLLAELDSAEFPSEGQSPFGAGGRRFAEVLRRLSGKSKLLR